MSEPSFLPFPADLIPAEELSSSLDPPGTLTHAEYLAEALLPGLTVRMWRSEAVSELMPWLSADEGKSKQMVAVPNGASLRIICIKKQVKTLTKPEQLLCGDSLN
jgi:hypothetical protein